MPDSLGTPTPQFGTAEYAGVTATERCQFCHQSPGKTYYRVNGVMACSACAQRAQHELPKDSHSMFGRALIFGIGGAILGLIIYAMFAIVTGLMIGYVSLAVGYIVGKAMKKGSGGAGGRRYQVAAVALTYAAVSLAAIPIYISVYAKQQGTKPAQAQQHEIQPSQAPDLSAADSDKPTTAGRAHSGTESVAGALAKLAMIGLASPFLELEDPIHGLIGLVILFVGIRIAWKITAGSETQIIGPFENSSPASV